MKRFATWFKEEGYILVIGFAAIGLMVWYAIWSQQQFNAFNEALQSAAKVSVGR